MFLKAEFSSLSIEMEDFYQLFGGNIVNRKVYMDSNQLRTVDKIIEIGGRTDEILKLRGEIRVHSGYERMIEMPLKRFPQITLRNYVKNHLINDHLLDDFEIQKRWLPLQKKLCEMYL